MKLKKSQAAVRNVMSLRWIGQRADALSSGKDSHHPRLKSRL